jgi:hypothetical protein
LGGGTKPVWRLDGRELYFIAANRQLMAVSVRRLEFGTPKALFDSRIVSGSNVTS